MARKWSPWLENDGSRLPRMDRDYWFRLAIYRAGRPRSEYVASVEFYTHPSKEPFQSARKLKSLVEVAVFFITYDPLALLRHNVGQARSREMRELYDFQLTELLLMLDEAEPIFRH